MARVAPSFDKHGPVSINRRTDAPWRLRLLSAAVRQYMPDEWIGPLKARARGAASAAAAASIEERGRVHVDTRPRAEGDLLADWLERYAGARAADMSETDIRQRAEKIAALANKARHGWDALALAAWVEKHGAESAATKIRAAAVLGKDVDGWRERACCARWWRRQLRRYVARHHERGAYELGMVGAAAGQWYCSNRAVKRRISQQAANVQMMAASVIENEAGQRMTLLDVAARSVSNKAIRRGELMTRIRGCEQWADQSGMVGLFTTNTCPSRFHAQRKGGGINPRYDGSTPADAQRWLCLQWSRLRAKWARDGIRVMGFRVAEPHHDGCPHWHMLLWCEPQHAAAVEQTMVAQWLKDSGSEPGAAKHRCAVKAMLPGMAAGYIAKYIAKNIDDAHVGDGHTDDEAPSMVAGPDLLGDMEVKPSMRVEAWASTWGIRQFQGIGQPPVTVWRELRRVTLEAVAAGSDALIHAWLAVHRAGDRLADWGRYIRAQGGAMLRRVDYSLAVHHTERQRRGRYEPVVEKWACGVTERGAAVTPSARQRWGGEGFAERRAAPPWTRFNNCTRGKPQGGWGAAIERLAAIGSMHEPEPPEPEIVPVDFTAERFEGAAWQA